MDNSAHNNIQLEIEMTNRERGDSVISDIETALDIPKNKNKTLTKEEIKAIDKCNETYDKYEWIIRSTTTILGIACVVGLVYIICYGFIKVVEQVINY